MEYFNDYLPRTVFRSRLSFQPLIRRWKNIVENNSPGSHSLYVYLLNKVSAYSELLHAIDDYKVLKQHEELIAEISASLFPISLSEDEKLFYAGIPFSKKILFASKRYQKNFVDDGISHFNDRDTEEKLLMAKISLSYQIILEQLYQMETSRQIVAVLPFRDGQSGLDRYMELRFDAGFVDVVVPKKKLPSLPPGDYMPGKEIKKPEFLRKLMQQLPLDQFEFEGLMLVYLSDITEQESVNQIQQITGNDAAFTDKDQRKHFQKIAGSLLSIPGLHFGLTTFFTINRHLIFPESFEEGSIMFQNISATEDKIRLHRNFGELFKKNPKKYLLIPDITEISLTNDPVLQCLQLSPGKSILLIPVINKNAELIGILELYAETANSLSADHVHRMETVVSLFETALQKTNDQIENQANRIIKEQFTAVQPAVEWRFTDAAINYISGLRKEDDSKIEPIIFNQVYPFYASIDIRNSSGERTHAIRQDLAEQLRLVSGIVTRSQQQLPYALLREVENRINDYIASIGQFLTADDQHTIQDFLLGEATELLKYIDDTIPAEHDAVEKYFRIIDGTLEAGYYHRKGFEDSITFLNDKIAGFIDREQTDAQRIFPHYYERFVTDGVEFNLYAGETITPYKKFHPFYLKNLKLWQFGTLAKAARLTERLKQNLSLSLQTTQLLLVYNQPITIRFRTAERKFDVDGVQNVHYEILKKRIDKVRIKHTNERLTQPGTIAIVYAHPKDGTEYQQYISYFKKQQLLRGETEKYDLEELQGVSGLKALRVKVMPEDEQEIA